jgi:hypothetical protein
MALPGTGSFFARFFPGGFVETLFLGEFLRLPFLAGMAHLYGCWLNWTIPEVTLWALTRI